MRYILSLLFSLSALGATIDPLNTVVVWTGDSLTEWGGGLGGPPATLTNNHVAWKDWYVFTNTAHQSDGVTALDNRYAAEVSPWMQIAGKTKLVSVWIGANGLDENLWNSYVSNYVYRAKTNGATYAMVWTVMSQTAKLTDSTWIANQSLYRSQVLAATNVDFVLDAQTILTDPTDTDYFTDGLHQTALGNTILASNLNVVLNAGPRWSQQSTGSRIICNKLTVGR